MPLLKRRPKIRVRMPRVVTPGESFLAEVVLEAKAPVDVEWVDVTFVGDEEVRWNSGENSKSARHRLVSLRGRACGPGTIPEGRTKLGVRFEVPARCSPSYNTRSAATTYEVVVRAKIAWWPDAVARFTAFVGAAAAAPVEADPRVYSTHPEGAPRGEGHIEVSLKSRVVVPGGALTGAAALHNVHNNRYTGLKVTLVGEQTLRDQYGKVVVQPRSAHRYTLTVPVGDVREGLSVPFSMRLPNDLVPSGDAQLWSLRWWLEARAEVAWGRDVLVRAPIEMLPGGTKVHKSRYAAPSVGSERVQQIWQGVANALGLTLHEDALQTARDGVDVRVERRTLGGEGTFLTGTLRYRDVGLGVSGGRAAGFRRIVTGGISLGESRWDRLHHLTARDERQAQVFVARLRGWLMAYRLEALDDTHLVVMHRDAGQSAAVLQRFTHSMLELAEELPKAQAAVPAPAPYAGHTEHWTHLAKRLRGALALTDMSVRGELGGMRAVVQTRWLRAGEPVLTNVQLSPEGVFDAKYHLAIAGGEVLSGSLDALPRDARLFLAELGSNYDAVSVEQNSVSVDLPAPLFEITEIERALDRLARLAKMLLGAVGPYR